jgi:transaldolase
MTRPLRIAGPGAGVDIDATERAAARRDPSEIASVASFFVSRVDTKVDARLAKFRTPEATRLRGKAAIANARLAYQHYERMLASPRWAALAAAGPARSGRWGTRPRSRTRPTPTPGR